MKALSSYNTILNKLRIDLLYKSGVFDGTKYPNVMSATINLNAIEANCLTLNGTDNKIIITNADVANIDKVKAFVLDGTWQEVTSDTDLYSISGTTLTLFYDSGWYGNRIAYFKAYDDADVLLFDFVFSMGSNDVIYDKENKAGYDLAGTTSTGTSWANTQDLIHTNVIQGFDYWERDSNSEPLFIPLANDGTSIKGTEDSITGYTWVSKHEQSDDKKILPSENTYKYDEVASIIAADVNNWAFTAGSANTLVYSDLIANVEANDSIFFRVETLYEDRNLWYSAAQTGSALVKIKNYVSI